MIKMKTDQLKPITELDGSEGHVMGGANQLAERVKACDQARHPEGYTQKPLLQLVL